jgi:ribonuclease P protein component
MLSRQHRFHGLNSLRITYKNGQTVRSPQITLRYFLNKRRQTYRCAVVVSKKIEKSAVKRNRLRRRIFEVVRQLEPKISQPYDLVLNVYSGALADLTGRELTGLVKDLLVKAGVIDAKS